MIKHMYKSDHPSYTEHLSKRSPAYPGSLHRLDENRHQCHTQAAWSHSWVAVVLVIADGETRQTSTNDFIIRLRPSECMATTCVQGIQREASLFASKPCSLGRSSGILLIKTKARRPHRPPILLPREFFWGLAAATRT